MLEGDDVEGGDGPRLGDRVVEDGSAVSYWHAAILTQIHSITNTCKCFQLKWSGFALGPDPESL